MKVIFSTDDLKDLILQNLEGTLSEDVIRDIDKEKIIFLVEEGNDIDGYYMQKTEVFEMHIENL